MGRARRWAYDVTINLIANLLAAGVVYLAAAGVGLLPSEPVLIWLAILPLVLCVVAAVTAVGYRRIQEGRKPRIVAFAVGLSAGSIIVLEGLIWSTSFPFWVRLILAVVVPIALLLIGVPLFRELVRDVEDQEWTADGYYLGPDAPVSVGTPAALGPPTVAPPSVMVQVTGPLGVSSVRVLLDSSTPMALHLDARGHLWGRPLTTRPTDERGSVSR